MTTTQDTAARTTCPYDGHPITAVQQDGDWPIFHPCGHPAPPQHPTWDDFRKAVARRALVRAS